MKKYLIPVFSTILTMFFVVSPVMASTTEVVMGNTATFENDPGWMFGRDPGNQTPFAFVEGNEKIGDGSLYVSPIGSTPSAKFIGEYFINLPISELNSFSVDFKIPDGRPLSDKSHYYLNVYTNFGSSEDYKYYDCRYDVVASVATVGEYSTLTFDPNSSYTVDKRGSSPFNCPASPSTMDSSSSGSNVRAISINLGQSNATDVGVEGYFDNAVLNTDNGITVFDFEYADLDGDGVPYPQDLCPMSIEDDWGMDAGVNRWQVVDGVWTQKQPVKKGKGTVMVENSMYDTKGCTATDYLTWLKDNDKGEYGGHWKYGLSSSLLDQLVLDLSDGVVDGMYLYDTVVVPSNSYIPTLSTKVLGLGESYLLKSSGTWTNSLNVADTEYASTNGWVTYIDGYDISPWFLGPDEFDLKVDDMFVDWGMYSPMHTYELSYIGMGTNLSLMVFDGQGGVVNPGWYGDNSGNLTVKVYRVF